jgi:hypothetical protein
MGIRAGLTEISPKLFAEPVAGGEPDIVGARHSIDKAWDDFHAVFSAQGPPLSLAIVGDCLLPQSPHSFEDFCQGGHDYYAGLASPQLVQEVAETLAGLTAAEYERWEIELIGNRYNSASFNDLRAAYLAAAAHKSALMIVIC